MVFNRLVQAVGVKRAVFLATQNYSTLRRIPNGGSSAIATGRGSKALVPQTTCTTTYANVSGTYDTSTDPVVSTDCTTTWVSDGSTGAGGGDGGGCGPTDPTCSGVRDKYPRYPSQAERDCQASGGHFLTVTSTGDTTYSPSSTLVQGFQNPGNCIGLTIFLWSNSITVITLDSLPITSLYDVGVRVNTDCTTSFAPAF